MTDQRRQDEVRRRASYDRDDTLSRKQAWETEFWRQENVRLGRGPNDPRIRTPEWLWCVCGQAKERDQRETFVAITTAVFIFIAGWAIGYIGRGM